jgi:hypothetical protein
VHAGEAVRRVLRRLDVVVRGETAAVSAAALNSAPSSQSAASSASTARRDASAPPRWPPAPSASTATQREPSRQTRTLSSLLFR